MCVYICIKNLDVLLANNVFYEQTENSAARLSFGWGEKKYSVLRSSLLVLRAFILVMAPTVGTCGYFSEVSVI